MTVLAVLRGVLDTFTGLKTLKLHCQKEKVWCVCMEPSEDISDKTWADITGVMLECKNSGVDVSEWRHGSRWDEPEPSRFAYEDVEEDVTGWWDGEVGPPVTEEDETELQETEWWTVMDEGKLEWKRGVEGRVMREKIRAWMTAARLQKERLDGAWVETETGDVGVIEAGGAKREL